MLLVVLLALSQTVVYAHSEDLCRGWKFHLGDVADAQLTEHDDSEWQSVRLPHTPRIEALVTGSSGPESRQWQGTYWYRKSFNPDIDTSKQLVLLEFDGAMRVADFWLNGKHVERHLGGYLPVVLDVTKQVNPGEENVLAVRLDNEDNPITGPKPLAQLDFNFYGGLYRPARLIVKDQLHITDPIEADQPASGGVFVTFPEVSAQRAVVKVQTHVSNNRDKVVHCELKTSILDAQGNVLDAQAEPVVLGAERQDALTQTFTLASPRLWTLSEPYLHTVLVEVIVDDQPVDSVSTRVGIRHFKITKDGFWLNGEKTLLRGTNRHQEYPYVGYALSDNAQYRDAKTIKDAGFDYIRLSHYPQSPAFMDACDELGLLVMNSIMGWQYFSDTPEFVNQQYRQCRELIRRDRNHPCVLLWEVSLNESGMSEEFIEETHRIAHEELPGDQCFTCGWAGNYDVFIQARQHGGCRRTKDRPCVVSEYGDWEYYAQNAGLHQDNWENLKPEVRNSRQARADGEHRLLQQATNFQEAHNDNRKTTAFADGLWVMFDYNRGYSADWETSGCMDIFRLPKPAYYFFQSQRDASENLCYAQSGPMVHIANIWQEDSPTDVRVFSNCQRVALYLNDKLVAVQSPDSDRLSTHLAHPPFTFEIPEYVGGVLKAVGDIDGVEVAEHLRRTPEAPSGLRLVPDFSGRALQAGQNDLIFLHAEVVDGNGTIVANDSRDVTFHVDGPGTLLGSTSSPARAGVASVLLQAGDSAGEIVVVASSDGLPDAKLTIATATSREGIDPCDKQDSATNNGFATLP